MKYINEKLEEFNTFLQGKNIAIIGLGVSNTPLLEYLYNLKANVTIFDKRTRENIDSSLLERVEHYKMQTSLREDYLKGLVGFDIIFRSPSCMPTLPEIQKEIERGAVLTTEIEMVLELCPGKIIGVTGSDGKTTTTSLIYQIIKEKGYNCYLGGNIGTPIFTELKNMTPENVVVLELSSFQLMNMKISPNVAVITNVTPNHLDIHSSYDEYVDAKTNIFKSQKLEDTLVLNYDNDITKSFAKVGVDALGNPSKIIYFSSKTKLENGYIVDDGIIKLSENGVRRHLIDTKELLLKGEHNFENICAALAATKDLVDIDTQIKAVKEFKGVEHRIEYIRQIDGVTWYNDSVASSPTRTIVALNSFKEKVILIAGGYDKHLEYEPLAKPIVDNVSTLILLGQTAEKIEKATKRELNKQNKDLPIYRCSSLEECIEVAKKVAKEGDTVILSPASASFDMFKNAVERGLIFKNIVNSL